MVKLLEVSFFCLCEILMVSNAYSIDCNSPEVIDTEKNLFTREIAETVPQIRQLKAMKSQYPPEQQAQLDENIDKLIKMVQREMSMRFSDVAQFSNADKTLDCQVKVSVIPLTANGVESQRREFPTLFRFVVRVADDNQHFVVNLPKQ